MKPIINKTEFGSITISNELYDHDVIIRLNGKVEKRKKKLSKKQFGTSHIISVEEAKFIYEEGAGELIIGTGQTGFVELSEEAQVLFKEKNCSVRLMPTPKAVNEWNSTKETLIGMFHVTC